MELLSATGDTILKLVSEGFVVPTESSAREFATELLERRERESNETRAARTGAHVVLVGTTCEELRIVFHYIDDAGERGAVPRNIVVPFEEVIQSFGGAMFEALIIWRDAYLNDVNGK